jgi:hypothetical protein
MAAVFAGFREGAQRTPLAPTMPTGRSSTLVPDSMIVETAREAEVAFHDEGEPSEPLPTP